MKRVVLWCLILGIVFSGCAIFRGYMGLKPIDKAKVNAELWSEWYYNTYQDIKTKLESPSVSEEYKDFLKKEVNPKMNILKKYLVKYIELVKLWEETKFQPDDYNQVVREVEKLISEIIRIYKK